MKQPNIEEAEAHLRRCHTECCVSLRQIVMILESLPARTPAALVTLAAFNELDQGIARARKEYETYVALAAECGGEA